MKNIFLALACCFFFVPALMAEIDVFDGRKTVATAGTREALVSTSTMYTNVDICALEGNTSEVVVGGSTVVATEASRRGVPLYVVSGVPDCYTIRTNLGTLGDLKNLYADVKTNADGISFTYFVERR